MSRTAEADKAALAEMVSSRIKQLETEVADSGNGVGRREALKPSSTLTPGRPGPRWLRPRV